MPRQLDLEGIAAWLKQALAERARRPRSTAIVPVGHGAAGGADGRRGARSRARLRGRAAGRRRRALTTAERDPFDATLSPRLAGGLNLGAQLYWLEQLYPGRSGRRRGRLLLWPQYWAWWLSGERASEVTSLGCHTDLWRPRERRFSDLAVARGWAERLGPLRRAGEVLGPVRPALAAELGLPARLRGLLRPARQQRRPARRPRLRRAGGRPVRRGLDRHLVHLRSAPAARAPSPTTRPRTCWPTSMSPAIRRRRRASWAAATTRAWMGGGARRGVRSGAAGRGGHAHRLAPRRRADARHPRRPRTRATHVAARSIWSPPRGRS